jgi:hypothetical protein
MSDATNQVSSAILFKLLTHPDVAAQYTTTIDGYAIQTVTRHGEFIDPVGCWDIQTAKPVIHRFIDQTVVMPNVGDIVDISLKTLAGTTVKLNVTKCVPVTAQDLIVAQVQVESGNG